MKILVLTKARYDYSSGCYGTSGYGNPIGLNNGAAFLVDALTELGYSALHIATVDGNSINKEVIETAPDVVVLEALWVTPEKVRELVKLHPTVRWVVRLHSNIPFLGMEGQAFLWSKRLAEIPGVTVAANNEQTAMELSNAFGTPITYLPNIYLAPEYSPGKGRKRRQTYLDVSCFGAIRPFKNQLIQAVAAMEAAKHLGRILRFHINGSRVEQRGDSIVQNMIALFQGTPHQLVFHPWQNHEQFLLTIARMDIGMQVSFTESFNIVAADHVHVGVPLVVSSEINWLNPWVQTSCTNVEEMVETLLYVLSVGDIAIGANRISLERYNEKSNEVWKNYLES